jgi:toxin ParE1/3/4
VKISIHPGAEDDVSSAAAFYEREGSTVLAARFIAEFKRVTAVLAKSPSIGTPIARGRRTMAMRVFPYTVVYRENENALQILVIRHDRRHPRHGLTRR